MEHVHELRQLVHQLVEGWPADEHHPTVEQARQYLEEHDTQHHPEIADDHREYLDALWYSL
jgi:hypothetical protein